MNLIKEQKSTSKINPSRVRGKLPLGYPRSSEGHYDLGETDLFLNSKCNKTKPSHSILESTEIKLQKDEI